MGTIEEVVTRRRITMLAHFTRLENVGSILEFGLIPRDGDGLVVLPVTALTNDSHRFDRHRTANCLTISFPNYRMFYSLQCKNPGTEWAVLAISPEVLWTYDCAYCAENAASSSASGTPLSQLRGPSALERLFDEVEGKPSRKALELPDCFPTNPQAEVLVFATIATRHIARVVVQSSKVLADLRTQCPGAAFVLGPDFFGPRRDYEHWTAPGDSASPPTPLIAPPCEGTPLPCPSVERPHAVAVREGSTVVLADGQIHTIGQTCTVGSPVGRALLGHVAGETVSAALPNGAVVTMTISEVRTA